MNTTPAPPYKVELLHTAKTEVLRCAKKAGELGIGREYAATLRAIYDRLSTVPLTWGEQSHHYEAARLVQRKMIYRRILVSYVVHEEEPVVFVKECRPVQGHPLESA